MGTLGRHHLYRQTDPGEFAPGGDVAEPAGWVWVIGGHQILDGFESGIGFRVDKVKGKADPGQVECIEGTANVPLERDGVFPSGRGKYRGVFLKHFFVLGHVLRECI